MYKVFVFALVGCLAIQVAVAKPKAKQQGAQEPSQIQELAAKAEQALNNVTSVIEGNLPDSKHVIDTVSTGAQNLVNHVQTLTDKLKTELKNNQGEIDTVLKNLSDGLHQAKANIQNVLGKDGQKKAKEIKASLDNGVKEVVNQLEQFRKAVAPEANKVKEDFESAAKNFLDNVISLSKDLQEKLKEQKN